MLIKDIFAFEDSLKVVNFGCFFDTSILFAFSYPLDIYNEKTEEISKILSKNGIQTFSNTNVKHEFLDLQRRTLIPECISDFLDDFEEFEDKELETQLKNIRGKFRTSINNDQQYKMQPNHIKDLRKIFNKNGSEKWGAFCQTYLKGKIGKAWDEVTKSLNLQLLNTRETEPGLYLNSIPDWDEAIRIVENFGLASSDAMILNIFNKSKIEILITADREMAETANECLSEEKIIYLIEQSYPQKRT
jgi:predicted nucleic acid-binding protein